MTRLVTSKLKIDCLKINSFGGEKQLFGLSISQHSTYELHKNFTFLLIYDNQAAVKMIFLNFLKDTKRRNAINGYFGSY